MKPPFSYGLPMVFLRFSHGFQSQTFEDLRFVLLDDKGKCPEVSGEEWFVQEWIGWGRFWFWHLGLETADHHIKLQVSPDHLKFMNL